MRRFSAVPIALGFAVILATAAHAQDPQGSSMPQPVQAGTAGPQESYTFAFQDADIALVVQEVLTQVGQPFTIDPAVSGKISFRIEQRLTKDQLLAALEAVLSANGVALVHNGDQLLVTPQGKAKTSATVHQGAGNISAAGYEVVAVPLSYAAPSEIAKALDAITPSNTVLYSNDKLGILLVAGSGQQLKSALETVKIFDQSAFADSKIRWFELNQAQASTVANELGAIIQGAHVEGVAVVPLKRLNGIIVFGRSPDALDEIAKWVVKLDTPGKEIASSLWVYHPQFASAEALARTVTSMLSLSNGSDSLASTPSNLPPPAAGAAAAPVTAPPPEPISTSFGTGEEQVRVGVDKDSNTMIVFSPPARWVQIQKILSEIDRPPRQVLIEASILEVTLSKEFQFGVDWSVISDKVQVANINNNTGKIAPTFPGFSVTYLSDDISAAVNALGSRTAVEVVSAPKIIALDNRTARLQIGDQVPVAVQSQQSTITSNASLVSTIDYRSTGVILTVTPRITGDNQVLLEVNQEVSNVARTSSSGLDSPTIQQRRFDSVLVARSGSVVALGGLISSNQSKDNGGIPLLKDIPAVGMLFSSRGHSNTRSELIVLLSAKILSDNASMDAAMVALAADMHELQSRGLLPTSAKH